MEITKRIRLNLLCGGDLSFGPIRPIQVLNFTADRLCLYNLEIYLSIKRDSKMVLFKCDGCGLAKDISDKFANKTVICPKCKQGVAIGDPDRQGKANNRYSISDFVNRTAQKDRGQGLFELESNRS